MTSSTQREKQYQALRLFHSNMVSLTDLKASFRIVGTVGHKKYSKGKDQKEVLKTKNRIDTLTRLTQTRSAHKQAILLKLSRKPKAVSSRADAIAAFATKFKTAIPANYDRYGVLVAKGKRANPPRHGSSKGKIAPVRYSGFTKFNRDFDAMARMLEKLLTMKGKRTDIAKTLQKAKTSIKVSANIN
jgi:hypothetical protein